MKPLKAIKPPDKAPMLEVIDKSREEIITAAAAEFMELGFAATSLDAIADRMGCTKGRIYHHFRSKADLFFAIQIRAMQRVDREVVPIATSAGSVVDRLQRMARTHATIVMEDYAVQKVAVQGLERHLLGAAAARHTRTLHAIIRMRDEYEQTFREVIEEGMRSGVFVDAPIKFVIKAFFGALNWITVWYTPRRGQTPEDIASIAEILSDYALRGLMCEQTREHRRT